MNIVECTGISVFFGGLPALRKVNLSVGKGEIRAIIGPNGAGKTTLFNVINGVVKPAEGRVLFEGKDITGKPPHVVYRMGIGRTLQIPRVFKDLTVLDNVLVGALFSGRLKGDTIEKHVYDILEMVGIADKASVKGGQLNIQERKKVELARALASKPNLLLIDEYMSGLNPAEIEDAIDLFKRVRKEYGLTIVWVEHVISAVSYLADQVTVLNQGEKIAEGKPEEIVAHDKVVEAYLGERDVKHT